MLGLALGVARDPLLSSRKAFIDVVARNSSLVFISLIVVDLDIFLDVAGAIVLLVTALESVNARFEQRLVRPKLRIYLVFGALGYLLSKLCRPKRPMMGHFIAREYSWPVVWIIRFYRTYFGSSMRAN